MHEAQVIKRLTDVNISAAFQARLLELVKQDDITDRDNWGFIIPTVAHALDPRKAACVQPFAVAWGLLIAALRRIDHVQDSDPGDVPSPTLSSTSEQYNLLLGYYLLATMLLDDLDSHAIPVGRLLRLRRRWADCLMRVASGQQLDLEIAHDMKHITDHLDHYEYIVQAKTGAFFALAFGGTATLLIDDQTMINILADVGTLFGMLVQYGDDLADAASQTNPTITLPRAYHAHLTQLNGDGTRPHIDVFWKFVYANYLRQAEQALAVLPTTVQSTIHQLFTSTFEERHHEAA